MSDSSFSVRHEHPEPSQEPVAPTTVNSNSIIVDYFRRDRLTHGWMRFDEYLNAILAYVMNTPNGSLDKCLAYDQHGFVDPDARYLWYQRLPDCAGFFSLLDGLCRGDDDPPLPTIEITTERAPEAEIPWWATTFKMHLDAGNFERAYNRGQITDKDVWPTVAALSKLGVDCANVTTLDELCTVLNLQTWRRKFHMLDDLEEGDIEFLIEGILPVGTSAIGALSGSGKTWFALSLARALSTGKPFLGVYKVPAKVNVLYLCPEMQARPFRKRGKRFGIGEGFYCQTISDGRISLQDEYLKTAIEKLKPVIFLDTAIRFSPADDENAASQNAKGLATSIDNLQQIGARSVVFLHHSPKAAGQATAMTLENVLRGTGDLGAITDAVWGLRYDRGDEKAVDESNVGFGGGDTAYVKESRDLVRLEVACVKARDFQQPGAYRVQLEPFIDQIGDLGILADVNRAGQDSLSKRDKLEAAILTNPKASLRELAKVTGIGVNSIKGRAEQLGFTHGDLLGWQRPGPSSPDRPF